MAEYPDIKLDEPITTETDTMVITSPRASEVECFLICSKALGCCGSQPCINRLKIFNFICPCLLAYALCSSGRNMSRIFHIFTPYPKIND